MMPNLVKITETGIICTKVVSHTTDAAWYEFTKLGQVMRVPFTASDLIPPEHKNKKRPAPLPHMSSLD